jgi:O-antigen/teichoic acid export membrane protein
LVVSTVTFSQWLIQRKIVYGDGGASENAIYSIGNQIFNMMTFIPLIITPIIITRLAAASDDLAWRRRICLSSLKLFSGIAAIACVAVFVGLRIGIPFLPPRYGAAELTGLIASFAAAFQILKSPFSLFFLAELKASREIASATAGALFMIVATATYAQLTPNQGTTIRLLGCALQALLLATMFFVETRRARQS